MLEYLPTDFLWLMAAFGFLIAVLLVAIVRNHRRQADPAAVPPSTRFTPHWHLLLIVGVAVTTLISSVLIPLISGLMRGWWGP